MKGMILSSDQMVSDVLTRWPQTIPVFLKHRMNCVGCPMNRFETLTDVVAAYHLHLHAFLSDLQTSILEE